MGVNAKLENIKASEVLMKAMEMEPEQGPVQNSSPESKTQETDSERFADSAELSNESLAYSRGEKAQSIRQQELEQLILEMEMLLKDWEPNPMAGLAQEISRLQGIYQQLLKEILRLCTQSQIGVQADQMNQLLLEIIDKMGHARFSNLLSLFERYGEKETADFLRASILQKITGRAVSPQDVASARENREIYRGQTGRDPGTEQRNMTEGSVREEGVLYYRRKGNHVGINQRYRESVRSEEQLNLRFDGKGGKVTMKSVFRGLQGKNYKVSDMERAERFLTYMSDGGNLYCNPGITAGNEELLGFLMAVSMVKTQVFMDYAGVGKGIALDVQSALERMFRYYLGSAIDTEQRQTELSGSRTVLDVRAVWRMYCRVLELTQHIKTPGEGIEKGLLYAWEMFTEKKEKEEYKKWKRYQANAGFFVRSRKDREELKEVLYGAKILDQDWKDFLDSIGQKNNAFLQIRLSESPWGMLLDPEKTSGSHRGSQLLPVFLAGTGLLMVLLSIWLFFFH